VGAIVCTVLQRWTVLALHVAQMPGALRALVVQQARQPKVPTRCVTRAQGHLMLHGRLCTAPLHSWLCSQATCSTSHLQQVGADAAATWSPASKQQIPSCFELQVVDVAAREQLGRLWQCSARKFEAHACETTHVPLLACVSVPRCYSEALVQQCLMVPVSCQGHKTHCESIYPSEHFGN
jgi:hypothetical protein